MRKKLLSLSRITLGSASFLLVLTILSGLVFSSAYVSADESVVDDINITVPVSCTLSGTGQNSHNAEIINGTYQDNIGTSTLHAFCNDAEGFAIYAAGYTGNEISGTNSNKLVGTSASNNATIETGLATSSGNPDISNWAMKLAMTQDSGDTTGTNAFTIDNGFNSYHIVPNEYVKVAHKNSNTDMTANTGGVKLTTTYAAYISKTQPADTYSGQVIYTLVHPSTKHPLKYSCEAGNICYAPGGDDVVGTMGRQPATDGNTITLFASNFSRTGYGFAGWSDSYDYNTNQNAKFYGPQEDITVPTGTTDNGLSLYAVWIKSQGSLQDSSKVSQLCGAGTGSLTTAPTDGTANLSSVSALTDARDNQTYAIAKLADGKCWMIENLRLESTAAHNSDGTLAQGYNSSFAGLTNAESADFTNSTTANSLYSTDGSTDKTISGSYPGYRFPRYNNLNTQSRASNPTSNSFTNDNTTGGMYSYGNYYTWHAAIADTTRDSSSGDHSTTSLCPTGWRLPRGGQSTASNSFGALSVALGGPEGGATARSSSTPTGTVMSKVFRSYPNNFVYSGSIYASFVNDRGSGGVYWSSTEDSYNLSYFLSLRSSYVYPGTYCQDKSNGRSIRCTVSTGS